MNQKWLFGRGFYTLLYIVGVMMVLAACSEEKIYKIGVNFSTKTKCIDGWKIAE